MEVVLSLPCQASSERRILVLDDLHLLSNAEVLSSLPFVLRRLPVDAATLLLSRGSSARDMFRAALRRIGRSEAEDTSDAGRGGLAEIGPDSLRFSAREVRALFAAFGNEAMDAYEWTRGWPIAVAAYAALPATGRLTEKRADLKAENLLDRCMRTQMWEPLGAAVKDFLLRTCIAETLTPAICARLCSMSEGEARAMLEEISTQSLLTTESGDGYVHHHLFRDFLHARLDEATGRGKIDRDALYAEAAEYHLSAGEYYPAMHFALSSGHDKTLAAALRKALQHEACNNSIAFHVSKIGAYFAGKVTNETLDAHPYLYLPLVWYHHLIGDAQRMITLIDRLYEALPDILAKYPAFRAQAAIVCWFDHRNKRYGPLKLSDESIVTSIEKGPQHFPTISKNLPFFHRGPEDVAGFPGLPCDTERLRQALGHFMGSSYPLVEASAQAGVLYEMNRLPDALAHAQRVTALLSSDPVPEHFFFSHMIGTAVLDAMERTAEARAKRAEIRSTLEAIGGHFLLPNLDAYEHKLRMQDGDAGAARAWLENYFVSAVLSPEVAKPKGVELFRIFQHLTTARALMVSRTPAVFWSAPHSWRPISTASPTVRRPWLCSRS